MVSQFVIFLSLQPTIPDITVEDYKQQIRDLLENQRIGPELRVQDFDEYMPLINGEVSSQVSLLCCCKTAFFRMKRGSTLS
jgi:hypothetical protein